ncbi:glycosyltransferase [uncultured Sphingomonas sp.]|uniref:glycosyltransferase family 4 protein n=1 Tax=uncultured Sphingomonas sp. TaxID=158754 RepID=UPI0035CB8C01
MGALGRWRVRRLIRLGDEARDRDLAAAAWAYGRALRIDPSLDHIWIQLGHALSGGGHGRRAVVAYAHAARLRRERSEPLLLLGEAAKALRRGDLAARLHLTAMTRPDFDPAQRHLFVNVSVAGEQVSALTAAKLGRSFDWEAIADELSRGDEEPATTEGPRLVLDVSDLVEHLARFETVSGIQRVQASVAAALDGVTGAGGWVPWVYAPRRGQWVELERDELASLVGFAAGTGSADAANIRSDLFGALSVRRAACAVAGSTLVNLGASWFQDGYFEAIAALKRSCGIAFMPFIHDVIPLVEPAMSDERTGAAFARWIAGIAAVADRCFANSSNTRADLVRVSAATAAVIPADRIEVVRLDATFGEVAAPGGRRAAADPGFALMVSTFEDRKNHRLAFAAWSRLAQGHGRGTPRLVCVGRTTDRAEAILADLRGRPGLAELVTVRHDVADGELEALYRDCLFTVYPSAYEGWGLPVTESLAHGRVPVVAANSALTEAGGELASYFETGSAEALTAAVERAAFDDAWRTGREALIARTFRARRWTDIAAQIARACDLPQAACSRTPATSNQPIE